MTPSMHAPDRLSLSSHGEGNGDLEKGNNLFNVAYGLGQGYEPLAVEREAETQAGSIQGAQHGTRSWVSRLTPWAEGSAKSLSPQGCPHYRFLIDAIYHDKEGPFYSKLVKIMWGNLRSDNFLLESSTSNTCLEQNKSLMSIVCTISVLDFFFLHFWGKRILEMGRAR